MLPLQVLAFYNKQEAGSSLFLTIFGLYSMTPLLFTNEMILVKLSLFVLHVAFNFLAFKKLYKFKLLHVHERIYSMGIILLPLYEHIIQYILKFDERFPFMPLMITSVYCSIGMTYFWLRFYCQYLFEDTDTAKKHKTK